MAAAPRGHAHGGGQAPSPERAAAIYSACRGALGWAGAFTVIQPDELSITDKTQPIFNGSIHRAEALPRSQRLRRPTGWGAGSSLVHPRK